MGKKIFKKNNNLQHYKTNTLLSSECKMEQNWLNFQSKFSMIYVFLRPRKRSDKNHYSKNQVIENILYDNLYN